MFGRILALALNTFRESVRDRVLLTMLVFSGLVMGAATIVPFVALGEGVKIVKDLGLSAIALFSVLIAVLVGGRIVYLESEKRTIYLVLARPVRRAEFMLGKYLGLLLLLVVSVVAMTAIFYMVLANVVAQPQSVAGLVFRVLLFVLFAAAIVTVFVVLARPSVLGARRRSSQSLALGVCAAVAAGILALTLSNPAVAPNLYLLWAVVMTLFELAIVTAFAVLFSTFVTPVASVVFTFAFYAIGHSTPLLKQLAAISAAPTVKILGMVLYYILPNLTNFNIRGEVVHNVPLNPHALLLAVAYAVIYAATLLLMSIVSYSRKDF